jgi:hypothetical protein
LIGRRIADRAVLDVDVVVAGPTVAPVTSIDVMLVVSLL